MKSLKASSLRVGALGLALGFAAVFSAREASALEPLTDFVAAARTRSFDAREQSALVAQRQAEASQSAWKLAPVLTASAGYTHNQYEASVSVPSSPGNEPRTAVITPMNQYDVTFAASIPIIDVGAWERVGAARRTADAAVAQASATDFDVQRSVAQAYYQVVANEAVLSSAHGRRDTAKANLDFVKTRHDAGVASELDLKRATAEHEAARQDVTEAEYQLRIARRTLGTVSGVEPSPGGVELDADTTPEAPLESFGVASSELPSVRAAIASTHAAERNATATRAGLYPSIAATGTERITNASGFGQSPYYSVGVTATWRFDLSTIPATTAAERAADVAHVREERARRAADDAIYDDYQAVIRQIEKTTAARAQSDSTAHAADIARQRYEAGTANYLDVQTAQRDDFAAKVSLIQASADLAYARVALHLAAGRPISREMARERGGL